MQATVEALCALYGKLVYGVDVGSLQQAVVQMLRGRGLKIGLAESCTAGLIAKRITEIPGSSEVLECGIVSYSNRIKEEVLGVSPATIETYGVISAETAAEMGGRRASHQRRGDRPRRDGAGRAGWRRSRATRRGSPLSR